MKIKFTVFAFVAFLGSGISHASEAWEYDSKATHLLTTVFENCPIQFIQAMRGADRVGKASYSSDRTGQWVTLTTVGGGYAPTFESYEVATLKISKVREPENNHVPDMPDQFKVSCDLTVAKKRE